MSFNIYLETLLSLFDCFIGGIVNYCSEIRVNNKSCSIEKLHTDFWKRIFGVQKRTNTGYLYSTVVYVILRTCTSSPV